jgi:ribosome-binding factor A
VRRGFNRPERVADSIQRSLAGILLQNMADERFRLVTITGVVVSRDLSYAKVYVSVLLEEKEKEKIKPIIQALNHAANKMRRYLARDVDLRIVPELKFIYDESTTHGLAISSLIDAAMKKTPPDSDTEE